MKACQKIILFFSIVLFISSEIITGQDKTMNPVTKNASPEAKALLEFFYNISGQYLLTGQHNYPNVKDRNTKFATDYSGKTNWVLSLLFAGMQFHQQQMNQ